MTKDFDIFDVDLCTWDIILALDLDDDMSREEITEKVFDQYRKVYDGQVSDSIVLDMCKGCVDDICEELEISD